MPADLWFPLMIYYADLEDSALYKGALLRQILELHDHSVAKRTGEASAWTGDVHQIERIHNHPAFEWINAQVGLHVIEYLKALAIDLDKVDVYVQRAWPVVSLKRPECVAARTSQCAYQRGLLCQRAAGGHGRGNQVFQ